MRVLKTLLVTFAVSIVIVAVAWLWRLLAGEVIDIAAAALLVLIAALWVLLFLAAVIMDGVRQALRRRDRERRAPDRRAGSVGRRFSIGSAMFVLALGRISMLQLGGELTLWRAWFALASAAVAALVAIVVLEWLSGRREAG